MTSAAQVSAQRSISLPSPAYLLPLLLGAWTLFVIVLRHRGPPFADQWAFLIDYLDIRAHGVSLDWLLSPHNEHRIAVPRLLYLADVAWFGGRNDLLVTCIIAIQLSGAALFVRLADRSTRTGALGLAFALSILFCLSQIQNLIQGFQVCFVGVFAAAAWAIYLFSASTAGEVRWRGVVGAWALLIVATLTMANGVFAGLVMVAVGIVGRRPVKAIAATGILSLVLLVLYLRGLSVSSGGNPLQALTDPITLAQYVFAYLGGAFRLPLVSAVALGALGVVFTAVIDVRARRPDPAYLTLFGISLFVLLTAGVTALSRAQFGVGQAVDSRYATGAAYFWASLAIMACRRPPAQAWLLATPLVVGLIACLWAQLVGDFASQRWSRRMEVDAVQLRSGGDDLAVTERLSLGSVRTAEEADRVLTMLRTKRLNVFR